MADVKKKEYKSENFLKNSTDFEQARNIQLESLMKWKESEGMSTLNLNEDTYKNIFLNKLTEKELGDYTENIQALLINPSNRNEINSELELENLVKNYLFKFLICFFFYT